MPNPIFSKSNLDRLVQQSNQQYAPPQEDFIGPPDEGFNAGPAMPEPKRAGKWATLANIMGPLVDGASTMWAMNQSGPNMQVAEGNGIFGKNPSAGKIMGIKAGQAALQGLLSHFARGDQGANGAKLSGIANAGVGTYAAINNIRAGLQAREANKGVKE